MTINSLAEKSNIQNHAGRASNSVPSSGKSSNQVVGADFIDQRNTSLSLADLSLTMTHGTYAVNQHANMQHILGNTGAQTSNPVLQMKWIDDRSGPYYEWDEHLDGVQWYALKEHPDMMFFTIVDPEKTDTKLTDFAGPENVKPRNEWVGLSGSDPYASHDPSLILIPTEPELKEELEKVKKQGQPLKPFVPQKSVYVLSQGRNDIQELMQYVPTQFTTEYIFDYQNNIFATGERNPNPYVSERHPYIAKEAGADLDHLAGGMLRVMGDQIFTNEASGHYGENWNNARREQFKKHVKRLFPGKPITHSKDYRFNSSDKVK